MSIGNTYYLDAPWSLAPYLLNHVKPVIYYSPDSLLANRLQAEQTQQGRVFVGIAYVKDGVACYTLREGA